MLNNSNQIHQLQTDVCCLKDLIKSLEAKVNSSCSTPSSLKIKNDGIDITPINFKSLDFIGDLQAASYGNDVKIFANLTNGQGSVISVAGKTGAVILDKTDVGLNNVDNTTDLLKPISTATQTALNLKQNTLVSGTNIKTINGQSLLGSGDVTISAGGGGTVSSVALDVPVGFAVSGSPITTSGIIGLSFATGYSLPTNANQSNWTNAYNNRISALTTSGNSGVATLSNNTLNIPNYTLAGLGGQPLNSNLTTIASLTGASGFLKTNGSGTWTVDTNSYITGNQNITLSGQAIGSGTTNISITLDNNAVINKVLTGFTSATGTISATDSIIQAIQKLDGNLASATAGGISSVTGTPNRITSTGGSNPILDISSNYVGQSSINTLGTVTTGVWNGTSISDTYISSASVWNSKQSGIQFQDEGANLDSSGTVNTVNFTGNHVTASRTGNVLTLDFSGGGGTGTTNLSYTASSTNGIVVSDTGTDATIPLGSSTNAGLISPSQVDKLGFISVTQPVNLDQLETDVAANNAKVSNATHTGDVTGSTVLTLATVNSNIGNFNTVTVNAKGLVTAATNISYLTSNQNITLSGEASGSGATSIAVTLSNSAVINKVLTGFTSATGTILATDTILQAIQKLNGNLAAATAGGISSVSGTTNRITSTGGSNPILDISASYVGQTSITTLGTVTTGIWNGTAISDSYISSASTWNAKQTAYANLTAIGSLANSAGVLTNNGTGTFSYTTVTGNATHTGDATGATALTVVGINGTNLASLGTGILKNTTGTGVPSIATASDFPTLNQNTTGSAATLAIGRTISITGDLTYTSPVFNGSTNITAVGTLATVNANIGSYGSSTQVATFTVNAKGLVTAAGSVNISLAGLGGQAQLSGTGFVKVSGTTVTYDNSVYLTANQNITLSGEATGSGTTSIGVTLSNSAVINKVLTGFTSSTGTILATDTILQAIQKLNGNLAAATAGGISSVSGTTNRITSTGGSNPIIDISASYVGQSSITTLGTITTGIWQGTAIADTYISSATTWNNKQAGIQFKDEGVNLGTSNTVTEVNFTGAGITASRVGNVVTVDVGATSGVTNLSYTTSATNGIVVSDTGTDATILAASGTIAGLMLPADFTKLSNITITQPVNLDDLELDVADLTTLSGVASNATTLGTFTGTTIPDNSTIKAALQSLETSLESSSGTGSTQTKIRVVNASTTLVAATDGTVVFDTAGTVATLPTPVNEKQLVVKNVSTGNITVTGHIDGSSAQTFTVATLESFRFHSNGTTWYLIS